MIVRAESINDPKMHNNLLEMLAVGSMLASVNAGLPEIPQPY